MASTETLSRPLTFGRVSNQRIAEYLKPFLPALGLVACALFFHYLSGGTFLTPRNLSNLSRQVCVNLTLAVGMTLIILTSGIDLSVGSVLALSGMAAALTQTHLGWAEMGAVGAFGSFLVAVAVGGAAGAFNGFAVSKLNITPFIVTLGMMVVCRGLTLIISSAQAVAPLGETLGALSTDYLAPSASYILLGVAAVSVVIYAVQGVVRDRLLPIQALRLVLYGLGGCLLAAAVFGGYRGIPFMVFVVAACAGIGMFALRYLRYGRFIYAIGGNREAARLSGVPVERTLWITYLMMGCLAGLAGILDATRVNGAVPSAGELAELDAIAAVVIGGTSLMGGSGSLTGTIFGVLIMGILNNGMSLLGISEHYQKVFKGIVIILAVYLDQRSKRK